MNDQVFPTRIDSSWTIFLDRDGVINKRKVDDYVKSPSELVFLPGALEAIKFFSEKFKKVIVVTNQQGIAKGLMSTEDLDQVHTFLRKQVARIGGKIDAIYYCPDSAYHTPNCRKPSPSMALQAQKDFPEIDFAKSIMVGDMPSDIAFGQNLGMITFWIQEERVLEYSGKVTPDYTLSSLDELIALLH